jgi:hypothetical protein
MRNSYESKLASDLQAAEQAYRQATEAGASANRVERIERAAADLLKAEQDYSACLSGRAY